MGNDEMAGKHEKDVWVVEENAENAL